MKDDTSAMEPALPENAQQTIAIRDAILELISMKTAREAVPENKDGSIP